MSVGSSLKVISIFQRGSIVSKYDIERAIDKLLNEGSWGVRRIYPQWKEGDSPPEGWHRHPNGGGLVQDTATVDETAYVGPRASVFGTASLLKRARVDDDADIYGNATVTDDAEIYDRGDVYGDAEVSGNAKVYDDGNVGGNARVKGDAHIHGISRIYGNQIITTGHFTRPEHSV